MLIPGFYFLKEDEQLLVEGFTRRWVLNGPGQHYIAPLNKVERRKAITLSPAEYMYVQDRLSGEVHTEIGPKLYFLGANEHILDRLEAIPLKNNQYIRIIDNSTGNIRVEHGEKVVYLTPTEKILQNVTEGINVDEHTAVLLRDTVSGSLELITKRQVFFPMPEQEIVEVRKRILLDDHETVVIRNRGGGYLIRRGTDPERAFFLEPYSELVQFYWSSGIYKDKRNLRITHIDSRPKFMWYEFEVRTQDNVELVLGVTFFWQIVSVEAMIITTDDAPGDICSHARSAIIQSVSQVPLERFLAAFNAIIREAVLEQNDPFYSERGVLLHAVEVRSIKCKDPATQNILQEIIQETTNRLNRVQKQDSENEIRLRQMRGEIDAEVLNGQLLDTRREHLRIEGLADGEAEASRVKSFFEGLGEEISLEDKIALFNTLRKRDILQKLSEGSAQLYFTPNDVNLSIESKALE